MPEMPSNRGFDENLNLFLKAFCREKREFIKLKSFITKNKYWQKNIEGIYWKNIEILNIERIL